ncbi:MAG: sugar ABC transporter permease [Clostridia bacterium]|nr:sugar ABC transporter permease [Clostridia bacterium]
MTNIPMEPAVSKQKPKFDIVKFLTKNSMTIALVVVFILFYFLTDGRLLLPQNMSNLMLQNGYVLIMACGMLLCILTGGNIDLSVGSVICLTGGMAAVLITNMGWNVYLTIGLCLLVGLAVGIWQGYWIGYVRIPPFITTLSGMFVFRGIGRLILDSKTVAIQDKAFTNLFTSYITIPGLDGSKVIEINKKGEEVVKWVYREIQLLVPHLGKVTDPAELEKMYIATIGKHHILMDKLTIKALSPLIVGVLVVAALFVFCAISRSNKKKNGYHQNSALVDYGRNTIISLIILWYCFMLSQYKGISVMLVWVIAICLIYHFITSKTSFGRYFYAVGGNEKATRLSGIDTNKVYFLAYANMGLLAGLCGLLCLARVGSVSGQTGTSFEMDAIGSCFIGGASAYGGVGTVGGVVIGALLLGVINMGMSIMGITDSWQYVVKGLVLLVAVIFDVVSSRKNGK